MPTISGGQVIPGAQFRSGSLADQQGYGPYYGAGTPTSGTVGTAAGTALPGAIYIDYTGGTLFVNKGTALASPSWQTQ